MTSVRRPFPNMALDLAPYGRWMLRGEVAQRRSPMRYRRIYSAAFLPFRIPVDHSNPSTFPCFPDLT